MTKTTDRNRERAEEEAAIWLVRLSDTPQDADLQERFEAWHAGSDLHAEVWARTVRAYDLVGKGPPEHRAHWQAYAAGRESPPQAPPGRLPADRGFPTTAREKRQPVRPVFRRRAIGVVAAALAACLVVAVAPQALLRLQADMVTTTAELRSAVLEDGSRIALAPESAVALRFTERAREVHLLKGQALFEVQHDPAVPFRVVAGDTTATVLGTAFEVRKTEDGAHIAVGSGRVGVTTSGSIETGSTELRPGEWLSAAAAGAPTRGRVAPEEVAAWRKGELIARDRPVSEVVEVLRRYHSGAIILQSEAFAARRVSGIFRLRSPAKTLEDLAASHGARLRQVTPWLLIVTER